VEVDSAVVAAAEGSGASVEEAPVAAAPAEAGKEISEVCDGSRKTDRRVR